ncbi:hypothetical protein FACS1894201_09020 [Bacteroidia bacterium]|nr:hypothetical protein FACS1894201_09020 [Bacteroidia bacterium]
MKNIRSIATMVVAVIFLTISFTACNYANQKFVEMMARDIDAQCPVYLNSQIRIDKCEALPNATIKCTGTMLSMDGNEFSISGQALAQTKNSMVKQLQNQPDFAQIQEYGVSYIYAYFDASGNPLYEVLITPDDYNN